MSCDRVHANSCVWAGQLGGPREELVLYALHLPGCALPSLPVPTATQEPRPREVCCRDPPSRFLSVSVWLLSGSGPGPLAFVTFIPLSLHAVVFSWPWSWVWCQRSSDTRRNTCQVTSCWCLMNGKRSLTNRNKKPAQIPKPVSWKIFQDQHILIH